MQPVTPPLTSDEIAVILSHIPAQPFYDKWVRIISSVASALPEQEAESILNSWSPEKTAGEYRAKLRAPMRSIGIGSLIHYAKESGFEVSEIYKARTGSTNTLRTFKAASLPAPAPEPLKPLEPLKSNPDLLMQWLEGAHFLVNSKPTCEKIDTWRGYPIGTTYELALTNAISSPKINGQRALAFSVNSPTGVQIGFHIRFKPLAGEKPRWAYYPQGIPALPFVLGGGGMAGAHAKITQIVLCEGQWDAIALAAASGFLTNCDTKTLPENVLLLGARGASGLKPIFDYWIPLLKPNAKWLLFRDNDKAGEAWVKLVDKLALHGFSAQLRAPSGGHKDLNDLLRGKTISFWEVAK